MKSNQPFSIRLINKLKKVINPVRVLGKRKIFCIGLNKTGTTSLQVALKDLNIIVGKQREAELLLDDYIQKDYYSLKKYCASAQAFQDFPFSCPNIYEVVDQLFPSSMFILTVRDSAEQWYNSLVNFHSKKFTSHGGVPTKKDLEEATYIYKGYAWKAFQAIFNPDLNDIYNKEFLIDFYNTYNNNVEEYFKERSSDFLKINISAPDAYNDLCHFLNKNPKYNDFPWENKT